VPNLPRHLLEPKKKKSYEALENYCEMLDEWVKELEQMMMIVT
jgi:hypothetical protein